MSQSKNGLASDWLTNKNRFVSSVCSQCIAKSVAGNGRLKTQLRSGGTEISCRLNPKFHAGLFCLRPAARRANRSVADILRRSSAAAI
jgi:hypothetical protein